MKEVNRDFNNCICTCDECNNETLVDETDYKYINNELRQYGWVIVNIDGKWLDFCSEECRKAYTTILIRQVFDK